MARSNGPALQPNGWPPHSAGQDQEQGGGSGALGTGGLGNGRSAGGGLASRRKPQPAFQHASQHAGGGAPQSGGYGQPGELYGQDPYAGPQGYSYSQPAGHSSPYAQSGHAAGGLAPSSASADLQGGHYAPPSSQTAASTQSFAPQFDPYAPQLDPYARPPGDADQAYGSGGYGGRPAQGSGTDLRGGTYDDWSRPAAGEDPRNYDLSSYAAPVADRGTGYQTQTAQGQMYAGGEQWTHAGGYGQGRGPGGGEAATDGYGAQFGSAESPHDMYGGGPHDTSLGAQDGTGDHGQDEYGEYEVEEPPKRGRLMLVAAALVGAIVVGGGLAYTYKTMVSGGIQIATPVVKGDRTPTKVQPADPGGKQFGHADSKLMNRLGEAGAGAPASTASIGETDANGVRKVTTLPVKPDGSLASPAPTQAAAVPGMTLVDAFGGKGGANGMAGMTGMTGMAGMQASPPAQATAAADSAVPAAAPEPEAPAQAAQAAPKQAVPSAVSQPVVVSPPAAPVAPTKVAPAKKVVVAKASPPPAAESDAFDASAATATPTNRKATAAAKPKAAAPAAASAGGGGGYVAVLASIPRSDKSRLNALQRFADMQQKYGDVLKSRTPDVQEANLGQKGTFDRLVVGPPGSRDTATSVCTQLRAQGYSDCWVKSF